MKKRSVRFYLFVLGVIVTLLAAVLLSPGAVDALAGPGFARWVFGAGGGSAAGGGYSLTDVVGQSASGPSSGGEFRVNAGYLVEVGFSHTTYLPIMLRGR